MATTTAGKVRAAVARGHSKPLEVEVAPPQENEVRVKIFFTSLCSGDIPYWEFHKANHIFPRTLGHEGTGVFESVGKEVTEVDPGDHVLTLFAGECPGKDPEKTTMGDGETSRFSYRGVPVYDFAGTSTFSEYTVVNSGCLVKLDPTFAGTSTFIG